jgi:hypothetical protein
MWSGHSCPLAFDFAVVLAFDFLKLLIRVKTKRASLP